jgi:hypothetical protein
MDPAPRSMCGVAGILRDGFVFRRSSWSFVIREVSWAKSLFAMKMRA